jgi:hypothetical protein
MWLPTGWRFTSAEGLDLSAGEVYVGTGSVGSFFLEHTSGRTKTVTFVALQGGRGGGPLPVGFDFSFRWAPSAGTAIYGYNTNSLTSLDFEGTFVIASVQGGVAIGGNALVVMFNYDFDHDIGRAIGAVGGMSIGVQAGASANIGLGRVLLVIDNQSRRP